MTNDDNILIEQLFDEARKVQIEDNGFCRRVMANLPKDADRLPRREDLLPQNVLWASRLWTGFCVVLGLILSSAFHIWELAATYVEVFVRTLPTHDTPCIIYAPMLVTMVVASAVTIYKWIDSGRMPV